MSDWLSACLVLGGMLLIAGLLVAGLSRLRSDTQDETPEPEPDVPASRTRWSSSTVWGPPGRLPRRNPRVQLGEEWVHPACIAARRDAKPELVCLECRPRLAVPSASKDATR